MKLLVPSSRPSESGNVLFLILIAVALFAALSFAVSQTTQNSSSGVKNETNRINTAYLHQFPVSIKQAIVRMKISGQVGDDQLSFAYPGNTDYGTFGTSPTHEVFHPQGGAIVYTAPPATTNDGTPWIFNGSIEITNVGKTSGDASSVELIGLLPGISNELCQEINRTFNGGTGVTPIVSITVPGETNRYTGTYTYAGTINNAAINGKDAYCYYSTNLGKNVFFKAFIER